MKKSLFNSLLFLALTAIPVVWAQEENAIKRNASQPRNEKAGNERTGVNQAVADILRDPGDLFQKLDTDGNGNLSREEFLRITSTGSQGTASSAGTVGVTGATGATGTTGATRVSDSDAKITTGTPQPSSNAVPTPATGADAGKPKP